MSYLLRCSLAATLLVVLAAPVLAVGEDAAWSYYSVGNESDVQAETRGLLVLQGGGDYVDQNYARMGEFGGGGDFVVLRASMAGEYNDYIFERCHCDSVQTIVFHRREAAFDEKLVEVIRNAEALFIAGGDQARYVEFWKDTPVEDAIQDVVAKPAPVGGTSAGMAILGEYVYSAFGEASLTAETGLGDAYHPDLTLESDFLALPLLTGVLTDQHLQERDRMGRTVAMLARMVVEGVVPARAIAADRETALHIDPATGLARVFATDDHETPYVYMLEASQKPTRYGAGQPVSLEGVRVRRLGPGDSFNMVEWNSNDGVAYILNAVDGELGSSRSEIY